MKKFLIFIVVVALAAAAGWFLWLAPQLDALSAKGNRPGSSTLVIARGESMKQVAQQLQTAGYVKDARLLYYYARHAKIGTPKEGEYEIEGDLSPLDMLNKFHRGEVVLHEIGFPEGLTYKEIAKRLEGNELLAPADLIALCEDPSFLRAHGVPGKTCEGYLFPDTYKFARGRSAKEIVATFIARHHDVYTKEVQPHLAGQAKALSPFEFLTLASIVEKETGAEADRSHVASVYLNRLRTGMRLSADPTTIYAITLARGSFDGNLHHSDLLLDIPYNTYMRAGLPPGPICNPGLRAMLAVVAPAPGNDLFFVGRNDGTTVFCPTLACHEAAVKKWQVDFFKKKRAAGKAK
jgi:UPF0755 protein